MESDVLAICTESKSNYDKFRKYIKPHVMSKEAYLILDQVGEYWTAHPSDPWDWESFSSFVYGTMGFRWSTDTLTAVTMIIKKMKAFKGTTAQDEVKKYLIQQDYLARLIEECNQVKDGTSDLEHVHILATNALKDLEKYIDKDELFVVPDISTVVDRIVSTGYEFRLNVLNRSLGLLRPGDFIIIAARVEVGKTTFLANEASFLAPQLPEGRPIVWVNNEEKSDTVFFRIVQSTLGMTTKDIIADTKAAMEAYKKVMGGDAKRIMVTDGNTNHVQILDTLFKEVNPGLIIFDQLDKVGGFSKEEREDLRLGKLYKWAREKAREYGPVIAASQLSADGSDMKDPPYIGMEALRGSKTDKPGEADAVITIGKYKEPKTEEEEFIRTINVPKNKLPGGGTKQVESERHGQYMVTINPLIARYE